MIYLILVYFAILATNILVMKHNTFVQNSIRRAEADTFSMALMSLIPAIQLFAFMGMMAYLIEDYINTPKNIFKK